MKLRYIALAIVLTLVCTIPAWAATVTLAEVEETDALGYTCISATTFDAIYPANAGTDALEIAGKGVMLPPICTPNPCLVSPIRQDVEDSWGRALTTREWDVYYSRYADYCRKETTPFTASEPEPRGDTPVAALTTYIGTPQATATAQAITTSGGSTSISYGGSTFTGGSFTGGSFTDNSVTGDVYNNAIITTITGDTFVDDSTTITAICSNVLSPNGTVDCSTTTTTTVTPTLSAVPLPAAAWMLLAGIGLLGGMKATRKTT